MNFKKSNTVGISISAARKAAGLSQEALASRLHVTRQTISNWEVGKSMPDIDSLKLLAEALSVPVEQLIYGKPQGSEKQGWKYEELLNEDFLIWLCTVLSQLVLVMGLLWGLRSGSGAGSDGHGVVFRFYWGDAFPIWAASVIAAVILVAQAKILRLLEKQSDRT